MFVPVFSLMRRISPRNALVLGVLSTRGGEAGSREEARCEDQHRAKLALAEPTPRPERPSCRQQQFMEVTIVSTSNKPTVCTMKQGAARFCLQQYLITSPDFPNADRGPMVTDH